MAGIELPPVDPVQFNDWGERMQPRMKILTQEREKAVRAYKESVRINPNDAAVWVKLGTLYAWLEDPENVKASFDHALILRPDDISILTDIGDGYDHLGDHGKAAQLFREAVRLQPANADLWVGLARVLKATDHTQAMQALQRAEELKPRSAQTWVLIGMDYKSLNKYQNAEAAFEEAARIEPKPLNLFLLGQLYIANHDKRKFRKVCDRLREIDPPSANTLEREWR